MGNLWRMRSSDGQDSLSDHISLLPGEDPRTEDLGEIRDWVSVYSGLIATSATMRSAASEVVHWRQRLDYWQRRYRLRRAELS